MEKKLIKCDFEKIAEDEIYKMIDIDKIIVVYYPDLILRSHNIHLLENYEKEMSKLNSNSNIKVIVNGKIYINGKPYLTDYPFKK